MPRGGKVKGGHKGRAKRYTSVEEVREQEEKKEREQEWRKKKGITESDEEQEDEEGGAASSAPARGGASRDPDAASSEEEESDDDSDESDEMFKKEKTKGVEGLVEIENPNRVAQKSKKVTDIDMDATVVLSRREREEVERQKAEASYRKKHKAGQTEEAQRDLARLAIIRQQRAETQRKKEAEKKARELEAAGKKKK